MAGAEAVGERAKPHRVNGGKKRWAWGKRREMTFGRSQE